MKFTKWHYSGALFSGCLLLSKRHPLKRFKRTHCSAASSSSFSSWTNRWFTGVDVPSPVFAMEGKNIKVLTHPVTFYEELLVRSAAAKKRITLASLYLGNGEKEEKLVETIYKNMETSDVIDVNILLEGTRGSRGSKNSRTLLLPLLQDFGSRTHVGLFHSPILRGLKRALIPERFNETINVTHLKVYLFDDTLIMSGANLSHDYFTNRQDRYIVFEGCPQLCDYFDELVKTVSKFSFSLQADDTLELHPDFHHHPYNGDRREFEVAAGSVIREFTEKYRGMECDRRLDLVNSVSSISLTNDCTDGTNTPDTLVFPLLQMQSLGMAQEESVIKNIISSAPRHTNMLLATAYFNLTDDYWNSILDARPPIDIVMAHPRAMGFYNAKGMAGGIPNAFSLFSKRRFNNLVERKCMEKIKFLEYHREGWTFHGKGMWAHLTEADQSSGQPVKPHEGSPFFTLIGSTNFSKRSVVRDMEAEVGVITTNEDLITDLCNERDMLRTHCGVVTEDTYNEGDERTASWWQYIIATYMSDYF